MNCFVLICALTTIFSFNNIPRYLVDLSYANYPGDVAEMSDNLIEAESLAGLTITG